MSRLANPKERRKAQRRRTTVACKERRRLVATARLNSRRALLMFEPVRAHRASPAWETAMWQRWLTFGGAAVCMALGASAHAQSFALSGSFSGSVHASQLPLGFTPPHPASYYEGASLVGSFEFELMDPQARTSGDGYAYFVDPTGWLKMSYTVRGQTFTYQVGLSATPDAPVILLQASPSGTSASITLLTSFEPKYDGATIEFIGPGLFNGLEARSIGFSMGKPMFDTHFSSAEAEMSFEVDVGEVSYRIGNVPPAVPEPSIAWLLGGGILALCAAQRFSTRL
jgi:hypothetical protein